MTAESCVVCRGPGLLRAEGMCVHEHLLSEILCRRHLERAAAGMSSCPHCYDADGSANVVRLLTPVPS